MTVFGAQRQGVNATHLGTVVKVQIKGAAEQVALYKVQGNEMNKLVKTSLPLSAAVGIAMSLPGAAWAQAAPQAAEDTGIEQVVVTAQRREELLQKVPISITVFSQQSLTDKNIVKASDLATYTPSLSADTRFGSDSSTFAIRGFAQEIRTTPSVGVYFDEVVAPVGGGHGTPAGDGAGAGDFFDLQNVQVLKGPQGTLFGRNTTGGAVLLVPQKPTSDFGGYLEGSYGDYGMQRLQGVINLPLNDKMRLRLGFDEQTRDGYLNNISGIGPSHFGDVSYYALRASFDWDVTSDLENYTVARFSHSQNDGTLQQLVGCDPNAQLGQLLYSLCAPALARVHGQGFWAVDNPFPNPESLVQQWQVINTTTWSATDDLTVKNIISYGQFRNRYRGSIFGEDFKTPANLVIPLGGGVSISIPVNPAFVGDQLNVTDSNPPPGYDTNDQSTFTEELQFQGSGFGNRLIWQGGLYTQISDPLATTGSLSNNFSSCTNLNALQCTDILGETLAGALTGGAGIGLGAIHYRDYAAYGQATYDITDELKLTGGIRYTYDHTNGFAQTILYNFPTPNVPVGSCPLGFVGPAYNPASSKNCITSKSQTSQAPTWVVNLQYSPTDDVMVYGKYARGYRQGSVSPDSPIGLQSFAPEKVDTYEVGAKTSWAGMIPGIFNVAAFYNDFTNQQLQVGFQGTALAGSNLAISPTTAIVNAGSSRIEGLEADATILPFEGFSLNASWSYLDSKLVSTVPPVVPPGYGLIFTSLPDHALPMTPMNKISLTGTYNLPIPDSLGKMSVSSTWVYTGKEITAISSPFGRVGPSRVLNANLDWTGMFGSQFDGALFVTNATNDRYVTYVPGLFTGLGFESHAVGEPRMYGVRLRYNFD
jgi:iron complex outermembrane receptor protein